MFLNSNSILFEKQLGFIPQNITEITEKIKKAWDSGQYACGVFLDLQKTFDTVNHDILFRKFDYYGIRGITNNWFHSYLQDRMLVASVNDDQSNMRQSKYGVPQGSVLGSLLFVLFITILFILVFSTVLFINLPTTQILLLKSHSNN